MTSRTASFGLMVLALAVPAASSAQEAVTIPPRVLESPAAIYPAGHHDAARVTLRVLVGVDGTVSQVDVLESGGADFDAAADKAVHSWHFAPATRDGQPFSSRIRIPFVFEPPVAGEALDGGTAALEPQAVDGGATTPPAVVAVEAPAAVPAPAPSGAPEEVTVRGAQRRPPTSGSDFQIEIGQLAAVVGQKSASDLLQLAPGIFIANEGGMGHADQVFLRGFNAEQGQAIEFTVNGVPINEVDNPDGHGYADTHFIIPETVKALHVIEGPFDPHQGDFAEAGSADYELGVTDRQLTFTGWAGSFNTQRLLTLWAPEHEREGTFGAVQLYKTDGFGVNRSGSDASAMAQYEGELGQRGLWRLLATAYATHYNSAGVVRADDVA